MRVLKFKSDGNTVFYTRVYKGANTIPRIALNGREQLKCATRTIFKTNNLRAFRNDGDDLEEMMVGPCDYFGNIWNPSNYEYIIDIDECGVPLWQRRTVQSKELKPNVQVSADMRCLLPYDWVSGKAEDCVDQIIQLKEELGDHYPKASLFPGMGIIKVPAEIEVPNITDMVEDITKVDLSSFRARVVKNEDPF